MQQWRLGLTLALACVPGASAGSDSMEPIDHDAEMATAGWWMEGTDLILVVRRVPFNPDHPYVPWPSKLSYDDTAGTTRVQRYVVAVEDSILGEVKRSSIELWSPDGNPVGAPEHGILFGSLWNLEHAGFDLPQATPGVQFYASDALHAFSPERTLPIRGDQVTDVRGRTLCLREERWFRACREDETPPTPAMVVSHLREWTADREGVALEGFDP